MSLSSSTILGSELSSLGAASSVLLFEVTNTCFLLLEPPPPPPVFKDETTTEALAEAFGACKTRTTLVAVCGALLLKIAAVFFCCSVVVARAAGAGVVVVPMLVVRTGGVIAAELALGVSRFWGGSGMRPLKLANISATLRRSVWLVVGLAILLEVSFAGLIGLAVELSAVLVVDEPPGDWSTLFTRAMLPCLS